MALENLVNMSTFMLVIISVVIVFIYEWLVKKIPNILEVPGLHVTLGKAISMLLALMAGSFVAGLIG